MASNKIVINDSKELTFEVPDSFMDPLISYLRMVEKKSTERLCQCGSVCVNDKEFSPPYET